MSSKPKRIPEGVKFLIGGLSGMGATIVVHPADVVKTRMQLQKGNLVYKNTLDCIKNILINNGIVGFYKGLSAGLLRQATYATGRIGTFTYLLDMYKKNYEKHPNLLINVAMGGISGGVGALMGNPAEVGLVRMMADGHLPQNERRNYTGVTNALFRITKEEGFFGLYRGCVPTILRSVVFNMIQLPTYFHTKVILMEKFNLHEGLLLHTCSSLISGILTAAGSFPIDMAKTRIQNMKISDGKPEYTGTINVITKVLKNDGFFHLYKGLFPYYARVGPHTLISMIILEQCNKFYLEHLA